MATKAKPAKKTVKAKAKPKAAKPVLQKAKKVVTSSSKGRKSHQRKPL